MPFPDFQYLSEVPGLAARRIAADILDGVLHKHRTLDDQLDGAGAHPGLKTLADPRPRPLMRRLVATILRRLGTLGHLLSRLLDRGIPTDGAARASALMIGAAQITSGWMCPISRRRSLGAAGAWMPAPRIAGSSARCAVAPAAAC